MSSRDARTVRLLFLLLATGLWFIGHFAELPALRGLAVLIDLYCLAWMIDEWWAERRRKRETARGERRS